MRLLTELSVAAAQLGWEVIGFKEGYEGLLSPVKCKILKRSKTEGILKLGGTILGTSNRGAFFFQGGRRRRSEDSVRIDE